MIREFLESVILYQGTKHFIINPNYPEQSLELFFREFNKLVLQIPDYEMIALIEWKKDLLAILRDFDNAACFFAQGRSRLLTPPSQEAKKWIKKLIENLKVQVQNHGEFFLPVMDGEKYLKITEAAKVLGCSRQTVYDVHLKKGLKAIKPTGHKGQQKIAKSELLRYMAQLRSN